MEYQEAPHGVEASAAIHHSFKNQNSFPQPEIAVLIPCFNEAITIAKVVRDFRRYLPDAKIYVYDNNSIDETASCAKAAGAIVRSETMQGKGHVIRRMFSDIDADIYIMVDGDDTYDASAAPDMVTLLLKKSLDVVNAKRVDDNIKEAYRPGHRLGNWVLTNLTANFFGNRTSDMLSGYRAYSRRFVKSFPALSKGFEIETELTIHALELRMPMADLETRYKERPEGSLSKLNTYRDGFRILRTIAQLVKEEKPFEFFSSIALLLLLVAFILAAPIFSEYLATGLVPRLPTAVLAMGLTLLSFLSFFSGVILSTVSNSRKSASRLSYLQYSSLEKFNAN